jgi:hypothetical protein
MALGDLLARGLFSAGAATPIRHDFVRRTGDRHPLRTLESILTESRSSNPFRMNPGWGSVEEPVEGASRGRWVIQIRDSDRQPASHHPQPAPLHPARHKRKMEHVAPFYRRQSAPETSPLVPVSK